MSNRQKLNLFKLIFWSLLLLFQLGSPIPLIAESFTGKVVSVADGDTITVMHAGVGEKIRLSGIDAPEKPQDFGNRAKQFVSEEAFGKTVTVEVKEQDKYHRTIGVVTLPDGKNLNQEIVKSGYAWWYRKYSPKDTTLEKFEAEAKSEKRGLWGQGIPIPPWEFRHRKGMNAEHPVQALPSGTLPIIGNKNSHIYHFSQCNSYAKVSPKNRIIFKSEQEAQQAGYRVAKNCN